MVQGGRRAKVGLGKAVGFVIRVYKGSGLVNNSDVTCQRPGGVLILLSDFLSFQCFLGLLFNMQSTRKKCTPECHTHVSHRTLQTT